MALNRFNIIQLIQIILIALVGMLIVITFRREYMLMTSAGLILLWVGQILLLNFYMNSIHRDVRKFMDALRSQDTSRFFNSHKGGRYFGELYTAFNEIARDFRLVRIEKEVENQFFREIIRLSASGIMAVSGDEKVILINSAALQIVGLEQLKNLSELREIHPDLAEVMTSGDLRDHQVKIQVNRRMVQLAVKVTEMNLDGSLVRIYSLLDISREMARNEVEAWQKLIRVLNHEITNSVVPLHILSTSLLDLFHEGEIRKSAREIDDEMINLTVLGLRTIVKRSGGLSDFINTYRSFTNHHKPVYASIQLAEMLKHIVSLLADEIAHSGVEITMEITPPELCLVADEKLIVQTIINLLKNSMHAIMQVENPRVVLKAFLLDERVSIGITDNGMGISQEVLENILRLFSQPGKMVRELA